MRRILATVWGRPQPEPVRHRRPAIDIDRALLAHQNRLRRLP